jgi:hypothetical protein
MNVFVKSLEDSVRTQIKRYTSHQVPSNEALDNGNVPLNCVLLMFLETAHCENKDEDENASHSQCKFDSCPTVLGIVPVS